MSENDISFNLDDNNGINIMTSISKGCQAFFKKFIWRIIYSIKFKEFEFMSEEEMINLLILEVQKPKVTESFVRKNNKRLIQNKEDRDIHVNLFLLIFFYF